MTNNRPRLPAAPVLTRQRSFFLLQAAVTVTLLRMRAISAVGAVFWIGDSLLGQESSGPHIRHAEQSATR